MHPYAETLHRYLDSVPLRTCCKDPAELFDLLYCCYWQHFHRDTPQVKEYYGQLDSLLSDCPAEKK